MSGIRGNNPALESLGMTCGALVFLAACTAPGSGEGVAGAPGTPPPPTTVPPVTGGAIVVQTHEVPSVGTVLTGPNGRTVYLFDKDRSTQSTCTLDCASAWIPLTTAVAPRAGAGVKPTLLTTIKRPDGSAQVVYNGHPLYYYFADQLPGQAYGVAVYSYGGTWYAVSPGGERIG